MECSLGISNFLEEISSLSHSVVFLYFLPGKGTLLAWDHYAYLADKETEGLA